MASYDENGREIILLSKIIFRDDDGNSYAASKDESGNLLLTLE